MEFFKLSRAKILNLVLLTSVICSCTILDPYIDRRRNPGTSDVSKLYTGSSKEDAPAICYNQLLTTDEELQKMADEECDKHNAGTHAEFVKKDGFSCKILLPATAYYKCVK
jgi:hypothetical protein